MPYPDIRAGMRLTAGRLRGLQWQRVTNGETTTVHNSTALVDTNLILPAEPGAEYLYQLYVSCNTGNLNSRIKFAWSVPTNAAIARYTLGYGNEGSGALNSYEEISMRRPGETTEVPIGMQQDGNQGYWEQGFMRGGNGGNFVLQFAQDAARLADTSVTSSSFLIYLRDG